MEYANILIGMAVLFGFYMAWNIGANDVANAMGTSVGSGALTLRRAVLVAAVLEFAGAFLVGSHVTETVRSGIVDPTIFAGDPKTFALGMLAALLAAGAWLQIASYFGWPVSTTHSIVGAIIGFGVIAGGFGAVEWGKVVPIVASWGVSPILAAVMSYLIFQFLLRRIFFSYNPVAAAKRTTPLLVFTVFVILTFVMIFKGLANLKLDLPLTKALPIAVAVALAAAMVSRVLVNRIKDDPPQDAPIRPFHEVSVARSIRKARKHLDRIRQTTQGDFNADAGRLMTELDQLADRVAAIPRKPLDGKGRDGFAQVERIFIYLQILSACFVAFAHGANDVANAIGPLVAVAETIHNNFVPTGKSPVPLWALALGGFGIVVGLATWGWRVIETVGKRITELTPSRGFAAEFGTATTIVFASKLGLPISTTHTLVGAIIGVGLARGIGALNLRTLRDIVASWLVTLPAGALLAVVFYLILRLCFA